MKVHPSVYTVSTTHGDTSADNLVEAGAQHSGCLERELAKRLAIAIDALAAIEDHEGEHDEWDAVDRILPEIRETARKALAAVKS